MKLPVKKIFSLLTIATLIFSFSFFAADTVSASESLCPSGYSKQQCYDYLIKLKNDLNSQRSQIENSLKKLQAQEGDLQAQVDAINSQISASELTISQKQVDIEIASIEIANIGEEISETKNRVDTLKQETESAVKKINEIALLSYKVNTVPIWYVLSQNDLISTLEMLRYFDYVVQQEKTRLAQYKNLQTQLAAEEKVLASAQNDIIAKRNTLEADNLEILKIQGELASQRDKQKKLIADLDKQEKELAAKSAELKKQQNNADAQSLAIAMELFQSGKLGAGTPVQKGGIVGFQGHTGCSYGSHLHFGLIRSSNKGQYTANVDPFAEGLLTTSGGYVYSKNGSAPYAGALVTQWFHEGKYLDMVSTAEGNQSGSRYFIPKGTLKCNLAYSGYHYLRGEGAPVRAILAGTVYRGTVDRFGGNFVIIDHGNNLRSAYYHLR